MKAGEENDWPELLKSRDLNAWTREKIQECHRDVRQEDDQQQSIVQQILQKSSDVPRRIIAPVGPQGGITPSYVCPHCHRFSDLRPHSVGVNEAREETVRLVVRDVRWPVQLEELETTRTPAKPRCFGPTPRRRVRARILCALSRFWQTRRRRMTALCRCSSRVTKSKADWR